MSPNDYIRLVPHGASWKVSRSGARRALRVFRGPQGRSDAMEYAKQRAKVVFLYGADGRIEQRIEVANGS